MTTTKKILLGASGIGIIAIACIISWSIGFKQGMRGGGLTRSLSELMLLNHHVEDQMTNGTCEGVEQAIWDYLKVLDKYRNVEGSFVSSTAYDGERMVAHIRLARIAARLSNEAEAHKQMDIAKDLCIQSKWKDCSEEKLVWFSQQLDKRHPIACLSKEK